MKTIELEKFIQNLSTDLYSFAFILIPDDLQATQLMIDSVSAFIIKNKFLVDKWKAASESEVVEHSHDIKIHLYKAMYDLSKKRYNQLRLSFKDIEDQSGFFSLEFDDKAVLFLQERSEFSLELIEFILGKSRGEVLAHLYSARISMVSKLPGRTDKVSEQNHFRNHN
ncbi:MAG: hypothetical protein H7336_07485 [Bacteriovorax sp.]|nr:hypothetical protein [Bacteriovorax sp.]